MPNADPDRNASLAARLYRFRDAATTAGYRAEVALVPDLPALRSILDHARPDLVFSASDHIPAGAGVSRIEAQENLQADLLVNLHAVLTRRGQPFAGSSADVIDLALDKRALKRRFAQEGIPTPRDAPDAPDASDGPWIVKPAREGNSRGISPAGIARTPQDLARIVADLAPRFGELVVERYLGYAPDFREYTVAMIGNGAERRIMPARVTLDPGITTSPVISAGEPDRLVTTEAKNTGRATVMAIDDEGERARVAALAARAFAAAGVDDYARCDIVHAEAALHVLEINGQPMIPDRWFGGCARFSGLEGDAYLGIILDAAFRRAGQALRAEVRP